MQNEQYLFVNWQTQNLLFHLLLAYDAIVLNSFCDQMISEMISI